jgi:hypothetical protein
MVSLAEAVIIAAVIVTFGPLIFYALLWAGLFVLAEGMYLLHRAKKRLFGGTGR